MLWMTFPAVCQDARLDDLLYDKRRLDDTSSMSKPASAMKRMCTHAHPPRVVHFSRSLHEAICAPADLLLDDKLGYASFVEQLLRAPGRRADAGRNAQEAAGASGTDEALRRVGV
jgi:hypothetical protein